MDLRSIVPELPCTHANRGLNVSGVGLHRARCDEPLCRAPAVRDVVLRAAECLRRMRQRGSDTDCLQGIRSLSNALLTRTSRRDPLAPARAPRNCPPMTIDSKLHRTRFSRHVAPHGDYLPRVRTSIDQSPERHRKTTRSMYVSIAATPLTNAVRSRSLRLLLSDNSALARTRNRLARRMQGFAFWCGR